VQRVTVLPRPDAAQALLNVGIDWATGDYWQEQAAYAFTDEEITRIEQAGQRLVDRLIETAGHSIEHGRLAELGIPAWLHPAIEASWNRRDESVYMRLDLAFDGHALHLLECNGQTPTSLIEASVAQWHWLEQQQALGHLPPGSDQYNRIHEALLEQWQHLQARGVTDVHFAAGDSREDWATVTYLRDLAVQAHVSTAALNVEDLGVSPERLTLVGLQGEEIRHLMWLWPFEFAWEDVAAEQLSRTRTRFIEPLWKAVLCSKGLLAHLHERYPDDENVLAASLKPGTLGGEVVRKPLYSREGQNVTIIGANADATPGHYGDLPVVEQRYTSLPSFPAADGSVRYPVIGLWVAGTEVCGMGVREAAGRITDDRASFVPHYLLPGQA